MVVSPRLGWLLFGFWLLGFASLLHAEPTVTLGNEDQHVVADKALWHPLAGPADDFSYASLSQLFAQSGPAVGTLLGNRGPVMARLRLENDSLPQVRWYLVFNANFIDKGVAYWQPDDGSPVRLAEFSQLADQVTPHLLHYQAINLPLQASTQGTLLLYVEAKQYAYPFSLKLLNETAFNRYQFEINSSSLIAIAVMLTLAAIALMLYLRTHYPVTLACAGYIGLHGIGWAAAAGLFNDSLRLTGFNAAYGGMLMFPFAIACASQFTRLLFGCPRKYRRLSRFLNGLAACCLLLGCLLPWLPFWQAFLVSHLIATVWIVTTLSIGFSMLRREGFIARYYLIGNIIYAGSLVFYMLSHAYTGTITVSPELVVLAALAVDCLCILLSLAEWLSLQKREYHRSYYHARIDPLTQVGNRYAYNERQHQLKQHSLLVFLDLDGMKMVNDRHGHDQGDMMLQTVARLMQETLDDQGEIFRTGGDEFIWLIDADQPSQIKYFTATVADRIANIEQQLKQTGWPEIGISFGLASSDETDSISHCMALADQRMYENKQSKTHLKQAVLLPTS
ncbi:GGDEF domain-containing protein [Marinobacterium arenosum]|uniref:GGDEF domain-containing protein n=1 Tax=Marinobacterium arenosum TaxID=2862496 RepID=UPI001C95CF75|nr:GGDEF domain-containing protein [Marinobacterium arenosum]MBY4675230.1 GGDEF domain-containing protein [Marinobacterium arenosum]